MGIDNTMEIKYFGEDSKVKALVYIKPGKGNDNKAIDIANNIADAFDNANVPIGSYEIRRM